MHSIIHIDWLNDVKNCVSNFSIYVCCICVCLCDLVTFVSFFFLFSILVFYNIKFSEVLFQNIVLCILFEMRIHKK